MYITPSSFQPFDPHKPVRIYRRNLPHWRQEGCTCFVTIHARDSLPYAAQRSLMQKREDWLERNGATMDSDSAEKLNSYLMQETERILDQGHGTCLLDQATFRTLIHGALTFFHQPKQKRIDLNAFVIMPNHVHILVRPLEGHKLESWTKSIKQYFSTRLGDARPEGGSYWFEESHDRIVRDNDHLLRAFKYIERNPAKANIPVSADTRWVSPEWAEYGWNYKG